MKRYLRHPVVQNALALYSVQFAEYALPLITVPYLARVLEPAGWGMVVYAQNFSVWLVLVLEYGFSFSATREIARHRDDPAKQADVAAGVIGANALLLLPAILVAVAALVGVPAFRSQPVYLWLALAIGVSLGTRPFWFFQGLEQMKFPASLNVIGRLLVAIGIFFWVKDRTGGWIVLTLQAATGVLITAVIAAAMYRRIPFRLPTPAESMEALRTGWSIFLSRSAISLYTLANTFVLGLFVDTAHVAYYGGAEKIVLAVIGFMTPLTQAIYPRMSHLAAAGSHARAASAARISLALFGAIGIVLSGALIVAAPGLIRFLLGPSYGPAVAVLKIAALMIPLVAVSSILGMHWMLPFGMDRAFNRIVVSAGILNIVLVVSLAARFGPVGTAWSVLITQGFVATAMWITLVRSGRHFWAAGAGRS